MTNDSPGRSIRKHLRNRLLLLSAFTVVVFLFSWLDLSVWVGPIGWLELSGRERRGYVLLAIVALIALGWAVFALLGFARVVRRVRG